MSVRSVKQHVPSKIGAASPSSTSTLLTLSLYLMRAQVQTALIWGTALGAMGALTVAMFPFLSGMEFMPYLEAFPPEMMALFGVSTEDMMGLNTIEGWLAVQMFNMWSPLALSFYPILLGANAIAGAEERGRLDMLLSNPIPRWQLVAATFAAMLFGLLVSLLVLGLLTWLPAVMMNVELSLVAVAAAVINLLPLCLLLGALALLLSAMLRRTVLAVALPAALLVVMYFIDALAEFTDVIAPLQPFSLFYYYGSAIERGVPWASFGVILLFTLVLTGLAALAFSRRDIYT